MSIHEIFETLVRKPARSQGARSAAPRARLQLESLESRMPPADLSGGILSSSLPDTTTPSATSGQ